MTPGKDRVIAARRKALREDGDRAKPYRRTVSTTGDEMPGNGERDRRHVGPGAGASPASRRLVRELHLLDRFVLPGGRTLPAFGGSVTTQAVFTEGKIKPLHPQHLTRLKATLGEGQVIEMILRPAGYTGGKAYKLFHVVRDRYAMAVGYDKQYAKDELLCRFGDAGPAEEILSDPPEWIDHAVACRVWDRIYLRRSSKDYTRDEMQYLIEMAMSATIEAGGDVSDL